MLLLYLIVDHLDDASLALEEISSWFRILPIIDRLNSYSLWSSFGWFAMRRFSEGPALSIKPFQKLQPEVSYFYVVRKYEKPL